MERPIFVPAFGNRPDQMVGREEVLLRLRQSLESYPGSAERATLLVGQRGMGKTALLLEAEGIASTMGYVSARVTCGDGMLDNIIDKLQKNGAQYVKQRPIIKGFTAGALGFTAGLTFTEDAQRSFGFAVKLAMLCERLEKEGKKVLILVDEVTPAVNQMRELAGAYQELVGDGRNVSVFMAGLPACVSALLNHRTLTFLNRAQRIVLPPVSISEVELYYMTAFERAKIKASPDMIRLAAECTGGVPYMIQLVGHCLSVLSAGGKPVDDEMLKAAKQIAVKEQEEKVIQTMLSPLSDMDMTILEAMSQDRNETKIADIVERTGLPNSTVQTYRRRLLDAGIIISPKRGVLAYALPETGAYLRHNADRLLSIGSHA